MYACLYVQGSRSPNGGKSTGAKTAKDKSSPKAFTGGKKPVLSQSLSFPAKGVHGDGLRKSINEYSMKSDSKHARANAEKPKGSFSSGTKSSDAHFNPQNKKASAGLGSKPANVNGGASARRTAVASESTIPKVVV